MPPTPQQANVIAHNPAHHGRVIAGPGTGKSWTALELLSRIHEEQPTLGLGLITFTRAATNELMKKVSTQGVDWLRPTTLHAYALRLQMRHAANSNLRLPLRIADKWETTRLIRASLAARLRVRGFKKVNTRTVRKLEEEMSAQWESLDPLYKSPEEIDPALRAAYVGQWQAHRAQFGYALLAEIPWGACRLLEDHEPDIGNLRFLVVDEYQDLNRCDIRLLEQLAERGVRLLAIGDDDQSIYGYRMAAPEGIREFTAAFHTTADYALTVSKRCGSNILEAAADLIETAPARIARGRLTAEEPSRAGEFAYLRFDDSGREAEGVAALVAHRVRMGVRPRDIAILVRSGVSTWADQLKPALETRGISVVDTEWVLKALEEEPLRRALATARIAVNREDSLAWWTLCHLTAGVSDKFVEWITISAKAGESFAQHLLRAAPDFAGSPSARTARVAADMVSRTMDAVSQLDVETVPEGGDGWGGWLVNLAGAGNLSEAASALLRAVAGEIPAGDGLASFLGQLEPVGKDVALRADAVRVMNMGASKGLTVNSAFVMGVEDGLVPHPKAVDIDEELRLLYVAMTRATELCVLTFAKRRVGATARQGSGAVWETRSRSPLLVHLGIGKFENGDEYISRLPHSGQV